MRGQCLTDLGQLGTPQTRLGQAHRSEISTPARSVCGAGRLRIERRCSWGMRGSRQGSADGIGTQLLHGLKGKADSKPWRRTPRSYVPSFTHRSAQGVSGGWWGVTGRCWESQGFATQPASMQARGARDPPCEQRAEGADEREAERRTIPHLIKDEESQNLFEVGPHHCAQVNVALCAGRQVRGLQVKRGVGAPRRPQLSS